MKQVHMVLQGKGGVGKSLVSTLLAQYLASKGDLPACIDTDPINATFAGYKALDVQHLELLADNRIQSRSFDTMMERIFDEDRHFVIDNGASSYLPLTSYLIENDVPAMIAENGKELVVHTIVTGGANLLDNVASFAALAEQLPQPAKLIVWQNAFFGPVEMDGKDFQSMRAYEANKKRVAAIVELERFESDTIREDLEYLFKNKLTFDEAIEASSGLPVMPRQRVKQVRKEWFARMAEAAI